jgi:hypothetical protein
MLRSNLVFLTCSVSRARGVLTTYSQAVVPSSLTPMESHEDQLPARCRLLRPTVPDNNDYV